MPRNSESTTQPPVVGSYDGRVVAPPPDAAARCPVCGAAGAAPLVVAQGETIRRCVACAVAFAPREPDDSALARLYADSYFNSESGHYTDYLAQEPALRRQARRYLARLASAGATTGRLLDVGCAAGFFLDEARRAGWAVTGLEVSAWAADHAHRDLGLDVVCASFLDAPFVPGSFDVVTFFNAFEHLPRPRAAAERLAALVRPGGLVAIETWNYESLAARALGARWHQWDARFVPYYYSPRAIRAVFDAERWSLRSWRRTAKWISLGRGCAIVAHGTRPGLARRALEAIARGPLGDVDVPYFTGDLGFVLLERRG